MRYLHTMIRVTDLKKSIHFYTEGLGFEVVSQEDYSKDRFTLVFLKSASDPKNGPMIELTYNWDTHEYQRGDAYGHMAYRVDSIEMIQNQLKQSGYDLSWGPGMTPSGKTRLAFVDDPDGYEIELLEIR
jgi:lactoylglutathione lyase